MKRILPMLLGAVGGICLAIATIAIAAPSQADREMAALNADGTAKTAAKGGTAYWEGMACDDGTNIQSVSCNSSGAINVISAGTGTSSDKVQGAAADGAAAVGNPVQCGGVDGSGNAQALATNTSGQLVAVGAGTAGAPSGGVVSVQGVGSGTALPVSAASLPLPSGAATSARQAAPGTAGSASADVTTIQGVASMTPVLNRHVGTYSPTGAPAFTLSCSTSSSSASITGGACYRVSCNAAAAYRTGTTTATAATTDAHWYGPMVDKLCATSAADKVACITSSGTATCEGVLLANEP